MSRTTVVVQAIPGRELLTEATLWGLDGYGGAAQVVAPKVLHWTAPPAQSPPFALPPGWVLWHEQTRVCHRVDLWKIMRDVVGDDDLILFEDDIKPCRNAVPYIAQWAHESFTTFHNMMRMYGLQPVDAVRFFWGIQSVRIPSRLVKKFVDAGDTDARPVLRTEGGDTRLGRLLMSWNEPIYYHRSLVQHVGVKSVGNPGARLVGKRAPAADFDADLDAMTLVGA